MAWFAKVLWVVLVANMYGISVYLAHKSTQKCKFAKAESNLQCEKI